MGKLEKIAENESSKDFGEPEGETMNQQGLYSRIRGATTDYLVDVSAGLTFYTPFMVAGEFAVGLDGSEVLASRLGASLAQSITLRPTGMLRNASAKYFNLTDEDPWYQKWASDVASVLAFQLPAYSLVLYNAGASLEEGLPALGFAAALTTVSGRPFGKWMDKWRTIWGKESAIKKKEV